MEDKKKAEIAQLIQEQLKKLDDEIEELKELTKPIPPENAIGRVSRMDAINNRSVNEAALRQSQQKRRNLETAMSKLDDDRFGLCGACGQDIPIGRLMLMPESPFCVPCASRR